MKWLFLLSALLLTQPAWSTEVEVAGLFKGAALLNIDGQQHLLREGKSMQGVTLIRADSRAAVLEYDGQQHTLSVHQRISAHYAEPESRSVTIAQNQQRQYVTTAQINGLSARVLVDTGANVMALNGSQARNMGIPYHQGRPVKVSTASGQASAFVVNLDTVQVGGIKVDNVEATVVEGEHPDMVLLGMSYLQHVEMRENNGVMMLLQKH